MGGLFSWDRERNGSPFALSKAVLCLAFEVIPIVQRGGTASLLHAEMQIVYKQQFACYFFLKKRSYRIKNDILSKSIPLMLRCHVMFVAEAHQNTVPPAECIGARRTSTHPLSLLFVRLCSVPSCEVLWGLGRRKKGQLVTSNMLREKPSLLSCLINIPSCGKDKRLLGLELQCWSGWHCPLEDHEIHRLWH